MKMLNLICLIILSSCVSIKDIKTNKIYETWETKKNIKDLFSCFQERMENQSKLNYKIRYYENETKGTFSINNDIILSSDYIAVFTYDNKKILIQLDWGLLSKDKLIEELNFKSCS